MAARSAPARTVAHCPRCGGRIRPPVQARKPVQHQNHAAQKPVQAQKPAPVGRQRIVSRIPVSCSKLESGFRIAKRVFGLPPCELGVTNAFCESSSPADHAS